MNHLHHLHLRKWSCSGLKGTGGSTGIIVDMGDDLKDMYVLEFLQILQPLFNAQAL